MTAPKRIGDKSWFAPPVWIVGSHKITTSVHFHGGHLDYVTGCGIVDQIHMGFVRRYSNDLTVPLCPICWGA